MQTTECGAFLPLAPSLPSPIAVEETQASERMLGYGWKVLLLIKIMSKSLQSDEVKVETFVSEGGGESSVHPEELNYQRVLLPSSSIIYIIWTEEEIPDDESSTLT